jgi:D-inositol-3-phosphate glycosyltransferase
MHLFTYASSTFGRLVGAATGIPTVIQDFDTNHYFPYPLYLKVFDRLLAGTTAHAFAASPLTLRYMNEVRRVPRERLGLMTHAVPAARFRGSDVEGRARQRAELGFASDEIVFVCPTKLGPDRGNEALFRAFARVVAARPRARLVLVYKPTHFHVVPEEYRHLEGVGDPNRMRKSLDELAAELGIADRVAFVESLDRPDPYLLAADVVVVPFENERFSSANLLDAFAHGLPAVATRLGEQGELVAPEVSGILVAPGDDQAMGRAMLRLADDPVERRRMGRGAEAAARERSIEAWAVRLTDLYTRLAQGRAAEPARSA